MLGLFHDIKWGAAPELLYEAAPARFQNQMSFLKQLWLCSSRHNEPFKRPQVCSLVLQNSMRIYQVI